MTRSTWWNTPGGVGRGERVDDGVEQLGVGEPEQRRGALVGQPLVARPGDELVEHRQRVTHRAAAGARRRTTARPGATATSSCVAQPRHVVGQLAGRHQPERVVVGAASGSCR